MVSLLCGSGKRWLAAVRLGVESRPSSEGERAGMAGGRAMSMTERKGFPEIP